MNKSNKIGFCAIFFLASSLIPCDGWGNDESRPHRIKPLNPITSCGWLDQKNGKNLISLLQQGLEDLGGLIKDQGSFLPEVMDGISIHIEATPPGASRESTVVWCITREGSEKGKEIVKELAMSFRNVPPGEGEMPAMSLSDNHPFGAEIAPVFESLKKSGYLSYIKDNVDHILLYDRPFQCTELHKPCFGEAKCGLEKTASIDMGSLGIVDTAALWVHEAAHLEGCYNNEEYALEKESDFRKKANATGAVGYRVSVLSSE